MTKNKKILNHLNLGTRLALARYAKALEVVVGLEAEPLVLAVPDAAEAVVPASVFAVGTVNATL